MASDFLIEAVEKEARHWPGVSVNYDENGRHRKAIFQFGDKSQFVVLPNTPSDHRAPKNSVRNVKRILQGLGAERMAKPPISKRERMMAKGMVAKIAVNSASIIIMVTQKSKIHKRFIRGGHPIGTWSLDLRPNPADPNQPVLVIKKHAPLAANQKMIPGVGSGSCVTATKAWNFTTLKHNYPAIERLGPFGSSDLMLLEETEAELTFLMPAPDQRRPLQSVHHGSRRPKAEKGAKAAVAPAAEPAQVVELPVVRQPVHAPQLAPPGPIAVTLDKPLQLAWPKEQISLEKAIDIINAHKKRKGRELTLNINDDGYLYAHARMGIR